MLIITKKHLCHFKEHLQIKNAPGENEKKLIKKAEKYRSILKYVPGVLCVCIGNSVAMNNAHKESDIDLFIITQHNSLWTTRFFITFVLTLLGQRKTHKKHAGKFCLSFFITESHLSLKKITIKNDIYLAYWIHTLIPIVNRKGTFERFKGSNLWFDIEGEQGSYIPKDPGKEKRRYSKNLLETLFKNLLLPKTQKSFQKLGKPFGVIIGDDILKFHNQDKRKEIRDSIM